MKEKELIYVPDLSVSYGGLKNALNIQGYDVVLLGDKQKLNDKKMIEDNVKEGGFAVGPSHDDGGIPGYVKSTGQTIEFEGGESIINKRSMAMNQKVVCEGTPKGVASAVNMIGGGVKFSEEGTCKIVSGQEAGTTSEQVYDKNKDKLERGNKLKENGDLILKRSSDSSHEYLKKRFGWYKPVIEGKIYEIIEGKLDICPKRRIFTICIERDLGTETKSYFVDVEMTYEGRDNDNIIRSSGTILNFTDSEDNTNVPPIVLGELNKLAKEFIKEFNYNVDDYDNDYFDLAGEEEDEHDDYDEYAKGGGVGDVLNEYKKSVKNQYNLNKKRFPNDIAMLNMYEKDLSNHLYIIDLMKNGDWKYAYEFWRNMDTAAREDITNDAYDLLMEKNNMSTYANGGGAGKLDYPSRFNNFIKQLENLSNKTGIAISGAGCVYSNDSMQISYSNDWTSGDIMPNGWKTRYNQDAPKNWYKFIDELENISNKNGVEVQIVGGISFGEKNVVYDKDWSSNDLSYKSDSYSKGGGIGLKSGWDKNNSIFAYGYAKDRMVNHKGTFEEFKKDYLIKTPQEAHYNDNVLMWAYKELKKIKYADGDSVEDYPSNYYLHAIELDNGKIYKGKSYYDIVSNQPTATFPIDERTMGYVDKEGNFYGYNLDTDEWAYAKGGGVGESKITLKPEEVWEKWNTNQKENFLKSHQVKLGQIAELKYIKYFKHLPEYIKSMITQHLKKDISYSKGKGISESKSIYKAANGMDVESMPIIGQVTTKEFKLSTGEGGLHFLVEGYTYDVVSIGQRDGHTYYVTNKWYKKHKQEPLIIVDEIVEKYNPY